MSLAATLVPTIEETLGAISVILLSKKLSILCLSASRLITSSLNSFTSRHSFSVSYLPVEAENDTVTLMMVELVSHPES
jgi:hypothetical protein